MALPHLIRQQLRLEDKDSTRTDLVLVGSRRFAVQLRVMTVLTGPVALAVIVLLRNALNVGTHSAVMLAVSLVWLAMIGTRTTLAALAVIVEDQATPLSWLIQSAPLLVATCSLFAALFLQQPAFDVATLIASVALIFYDEDEEEPVINDARDWSKRMEWSPCICAVVLFASFMALSYSTMNHIPGSGLLVTIFLVTAFVALMSLPWTVVRVERSAATLNVIKQTDSFETCGTIAEQLPHIVRWCVMTLTVAVFIVAVALAVAAVVLLAVLMVLWWFCWL